MLDKNIIKKLSSADLAIIEENTRADMALTECRLSRLRHRRARDPGWSGYDPIIDEYVGIDIRIEEQVAVMGELVEYQLLLSNENARRKWESQKAPLPILSNPRNDSQVVVKQLILL